MTDNPFRYIVLEVDGAADLERLLREVENSHSVVGIMDSLRCVIVERDHSLDAPKEEEPKGEQGAVFLVCHQDTYCAFQSEIDDPRFKFTDGNVKLVICNKNYKPDEQLCSRAEPLTVGEK